MRVSSLEFAEWAEYYALIDREAAEERAAWTGGGQQPARKVNTRGLYRQ